ncbi:response regulator transcription factor [Nocardiopsis aegyptia]|uniref:DNA-binding NarL/FixJ family response regulator n=1 Tax=Nocardiopsis aegyptia TaxID=220378 RepID=A0A7Z0JB42_9ACTN|nr:response regulator transcription factor [Nocardiopsis aegyptia]NYJ35836.1 DNA-binding NarL/FixJ family response regulator [Nocardiopsis aegyptia]
MGETPPIRVLIVDDQVLMREGLRKLLEIEPGIEVVGAAADGAEALALLTSPEPPAVDLVLADARMPVMDGVTMIERLREDRPELPVIVLTTFDEDELVIGALRAGAKGYLLKDTMPERLADAVHRAVSGEIVLGSSATERLVGALLKAPGDVSGGSENEDVSPAAGSDEQVLSQREQEVARLVGDGASNREIARRLFISEGTARNHVTNILRKLNLRDRTKLALWVRGQDG